MKSMTISDALLKVCDELLCNASDAINSSSSPYNGNFIKIELTDVSISVSNSNARISPKINDNGESQLFTAFNYMNASSNFEESRTQG